MKNQAAEKESEDEHVENGPENDPEDADDGLFVADLEVAQGTRGRPRLRQIGTRTGGAADQSGRWWRGAAGR